MQLPQLPQPFQAQLALQLRERVWLPWLQLPHICVPVCGASVAAHTPPLVQPPHAPHDAHAQAALQLRRRDSVPSAQLPHGASCSSAACFGSQPVAPLQPPQVPQLPHEQSLPQLRLRFCMPEAQLPQPCESVSCVFGEQPGTALHALQALQASQAQAVLQLRERVFSCPQTPQPCGSLSLSPAVHSPSSVQRSMSHWQVSRQVRVALPHKPHAPRSSLAPGLHTPSSAQAPMSAHCPLGSQC